MFRRLGVIAIACFGASLTVGASPAGASTTIGYTFFPPTDCTVGPPGITRVQVGSPPTANGFAYTVPSPGVITSWVIFTQTGGGQFAFRTFRPTGAPNEYLVTGGGPLETMATSEFNTFNVRIPVQAGDLIGHYQAPGSTKCTEPAFSGPHTIATATGDVPQGATFTSGTSPVVLDLEAILEPDADGDGFGDETQDQCPSDATKQGDCTAPTTELGGGPGGKTKSKTATFKFFGEDLVALAGFECSLDHAPFTACTSPHTVKVKKGKHTFSVRAVDAAGNVDATPATDAWKVKKKKTKK